ncbi:MAG: glycosyltransferase family 2 protein [Candidatus Eremiobacteraeota bacterium]|nr:glycosyltransferase family 2 protein [Candidatus Eremiobacteraeota bacterium]
MDKISIIIPTLNEDKNLPFVFADILRVMDNSNYPWFEIIVVDGGSSDRTVEVAERFGARIIEHRGGKGSALRRGWNEAKGDIIITMDADCSNVAEELLMLINGIKNGFDICMGSRFMEGGNSEDISLIRKIGNKFFVSMVNLFWKTNYTDLCYGYRSFHRDCIPRLKTRTNGFGIETEISILAAKNKLKVTEVPSFEKKRRHGKGKLRTIKDGFNILMTIIRELIRKE